jgi:hypothetical protein
MWQAPRDLVRGGVRKPSRPALVGKTVAEIERELILETLGHCRGNRTHAAKMLGISIRTLRNKVGKYSDAGIKVPHRPAYLAPQYDIEPKRYGIPARTTTVWSEGAHFALARTSRP